MIFCFPKDACYAGIAQLVEHYLAKVDVAGSSPVSRSRQEGTNVSSFFCCQSGDAWLRFISAGLTDAAGGAAGLTDVVQNIIL